jgi:hypothetical protein
MATNAPVARRKRSRPRFTIQRVLLTIAAIAFLLPFYLILRNALMTDDQVTSMHWAWFPTRPHWENIRDLFTDKSGAMLTGLKNSAIIAVVTLVLQMLVSSMAGYALARIPARGRNVVFAAILGTLMIPSAVTFVPTFAVVAYLGGVNTQWGIIAPSIFSAFSIFLFRQFYHLLALAAAELDQYLHGPWRAHLHRKLEFVPLAARHRPGPVGVDRPNRPIDLPHRPDRPPLPTLRRRPRGGRPARLRLPSHAALHRRRRQILRRQRIIAAGKQHLQTTQSAF